MSGLEIAVTINGKACVMQVDPDRTLLDILREDCDLTGAKYGCGMAQCGACTVLVNGAPARACVLRAVHADGSDIQTLEGLITDGEVHHVQAAFVEMEGAQCGYCMNGMIMTAVAFLRRHPDPSAHDVKQALRHNLCRCGTHTEIVASVLRAAQLMRADK